MKKPGYPPHEAERQREVEKYELLDTLPEESYDSITALMAYICKVPISLVSILDRERNFLKSYHGVPFGEDPRDRSFCGHAILGNEEIMIVPDAKEDFRFHDNPLVEELGVRFYACAPLVNLRGYKLGTLCVFDTQPKELDEEQVNALISMSKQVVLIMEERYKNIQLEKAKKELQQRNKDLKKFAATVSHDLKSPLANILGLTEILSNSLEGQIDEEKIRYLNMIKQSGQSLRSYIEGMLSFYRSEELLVDGDEKTSLLEMFHRIEGVFSAEQDLDLSLDTEVKEINANTEALSQILINLITNGIKYNDKEKQVIRVGVKQKGSQYLIEVEDNGNGMDEEEKKNAFNLFETNDKRDRCGRQGSGIGLATVSKLVDYLGGKISIESTPGIGSRVCMALPKASAPDAGVVEAIREESRG